MFVLAIPAWIFVCYHFQLQCVDSLPRNIPWLIPDTEKETPLDRLPTPVPPMIPFPLFPPSPPQPPLPLIPATETPFDGPPTPIPPMIPFPFPPPSPPSQRPPLIPATERATTSVFVRPPATPVPPMIPFPFSPPSPPRPRPPLIPATERATPFVPGRPKNPIPPMIPFPFFPPTMVTSKKKHTKPSPSPSPRITFPFRTVVAITDRAVTTERSTKAAATATTTAATTIDIATTTTKTATTTGHSFVVGDSVLKLAFLGKCSKCRVGWTRGGRMRQLVTKINRSRFVFIVDKNTNTGFFSRWLRSKRPQFLLDHVIKSDLKLTGIHPEMDVEIDDKNKCSCSRRMRSGTYALFVKEVTNGQLILDPDNPIQKVNARDITQILERFGSIHLEEEDHDDRDDHEDEDETDEENNQEDIDEDDQDDGYQTNKEYGGDDTRSTSRMLPSIPFITQGNRKPNRKATRRQSGDTRRGSQTQRERNRRDKRPKKPKRENAKQRKKTRKQQQG